MRGSFGRRSAGNIPARGGCALDATRVYIRTTRARLTAATAPAPPRRSAGPQRRQRGARREDVVDDRDLAPARRTRAEGVTHVATAGGVVEPALGPPDRHRPEQPARRHVPPLRQPHRQHLGGVVSALDGAPAVCGHPGDHVALRPRHDRGDHAGRGVGEPAQAGILESHARDRGHAPRTRSPQRPSRTPARRPRHSRQSATGSAVGFPQRAHAGPTRSGSAARHAGQTGKAPRPQSAQRAGTSRSSSAPIQEDARAGGVTRGRAAVPEPSREHERAGRRSCPPAPAGRALPGRPRASGLISIGERRRAVRAARDHRARPLQPARRRASLSRWRTVAGESGPTRSSAARTRRPGRSRRTSERRRQRQGVEDELLELDGVWHGRLDGWPCSSTYGTFLNARWNGQLGRRRRGRSMNSSVEDVDGDAAGRRTRARRRARRMLGQLGWGRSEYSITSWRPSRSATTTPTFSSGSSLRDDLDDTSAPACRCSAEEARVGDRDQRVVDLEVEQGVGRRGRACRPGSSAAVGPGPARQGAAVAVGAERDAVAVGEQHLPRSCGRPRASAPAEEPHMLQPEAARARRRSAAVVSWLSGLVIT